MFSSPSIPSPETLSLILAGMAKDHLFRHPAAPGFTPFWRVCLSKNCPQGQEHIHARERWFALYPERLGSYAHEKWPHAVFLRIDLADLFIESFRVSAYEILPSDAQKDNPRAFSFDQENEFFLPVFLAKQAVKVGCVQAAARRVIPAVNNPPIHNGLPAPCLI